MSNYFYDLPDDIITYIYSIRLKIAISKIHYTNIIKYMGIMEIIMKLKVYVDDQNFYPYYSPYDKMLPFVINKICKSNNSCFKHVMSNIFDMTEKGVRLNINNYIYQNISNINNFEKTAASCYKLYEKINKINNK